MTTLALLMNPIAAIKPQKDSSLGEPQDQPLAEHNDIIIKPLDVIGDFLTEVTVTSPTGVRELDTLYGLDIGGQLMDAIERKLNA